MLPSSWHREMRTKIAVVCVNCGQPQWYQQHSPEIELVQAVLRSLQAAGSLCMLSSSAVGEQKTSLFASTGTADLFRLISSPILQQQNSMSERRRHRSVDTIVTISHKWLQEKMLFVHKLMLYFKLILSEEGYTCGLCILFLCSFVPL